MEITNFAEAMFTKVTWGHPNVKIYSGEIIGIAQGRVGLDVTVRHDHGGVQTLTSIRPDYFTAA